MLRAPIHPYATGESAPDCSDGRRVRETRTMSILDAGVDPAAGVIQTPDSPFVLGAHAGPDAGGHYGPYGGRFVPEALMGALDELDAAFETAMADPGFLAELDRLQRTYTGRPSALTHAHRQQRLPKHIVDLV